MRALSFVTLLLLLGCSAAPKCSASTCEGCCDATGQCQAGTTSQVCGSGASQCVACTPAQQCVAGFCLTVATGGGGGNTGGGAGGGGGSGDAGAQLDLDRASLGFDQEFGSGTWLRTSPQQSLLVRNGGDQPLQVTGATLSGADATAFEIAQPTPAMSLARGEQTFVRVLFSPMQARAYSATLTVTSNAGPAVTVPLTGQGVTPYGTGVAGTNPECRSLSDCGSPPEQGGGCGCGCGCSTWVQYTDDGLTLAYTDDADGDGKADDQDNCPFAANRDQLDGDGDGVGNSCDNCASASNASQLDGDGDGLGDSCDSDLDGDTVANATDNCQSIPNPTQTDINGNGLGDVCDADDDGDGVPDGTDNCPPIANPSQNVINDPRCTADADGDGIQDGRDNCRSVGNATQQDTDLDGLGDVCDLDIDADGILNAADNCGFVANRDQRDDDGDGLGDKCDPQYCVVIDFANPGDCLNPQGPFSVHAGGSIQMRVGERFRLPLFANRNGAAIRYTWTVTTRPAGSTASVANPAGLAGLSRHWQYAYVDGLVPTFTPDRAGSYTLQLRGELGVADRAYPDMRSALSSLQLTVSP
jgi:hypothetical protein